MLSSLSAYATDIPVANLIVTVHKNCNTGEFSALSTDPTIGSDYQVELVSKKPLQCDTDAFLGKPQRFFYQIDSNGTVTFTKKPDKLDLFGTSTTIVLGTVDMTKMCNVILPPSGLTASNLVVSLLPTVSVTQDIALTGPCTQSGQIVGAQPYAYRRPFTSTVGISDSGTGASLSMGLSSAMLFTDQASCQNQTLP